MLFVVVCLNIITACTHAGQGHRDSKPEQEDGQRTLLILNQGP